MKNHVNNPAPVFGQYEARTRLERFSGSSAISSADLFDEQKKQTSKC